MPSLCILPLPDGAVAPPAPSAFVIEVAGRQAGLALRDARGFQFLAADAAFRTLDGSRFPSLSRLQEAASRLALLQQADQPRAGGRAA